MERVTALHDGDWIDFCQNDDPMCPHCGNVYSISENGAYDMREEGSHTIDCDECEHRYYVDTIVHVSFSTHDQPTTTAKGERDGC